MRFSKFQWLYFLSQAIGIFLVILIMTWISIYLEGFSVGFFNWHILSMTIGMVFLYGNCECCNLQNEKFFLKISLISPDSDFNLPRFPESKKKKPENLPRSRQWTCIDILNLRTVWCFQIAQFGDLFFAFLDRTACGDRFWIAVRVWVHVLLFLTANESLRVFFMPIHVFFGLLGFVLAIMSCLMGLSEKAFFVMPDGQFPDQAVLINCIGILVTIYGALVVYLVTEPSYKWRPLPEEISLLSRTAGWKLTMSDVNN